MEGFEDVYPVRQIQAMVSAELKSFAKQASECGLIIPLLFNRNCLHENHAGNFYILFTSSKSRKPIFTLFTNPALS